MQNETRNERDVMRIMVWGTAIAFGFMAASLQALRPNQSGFTFQLSALTLLAFTLGVGLTLVFWKIILKRTGGARQRTRRFWAELALLLVGLGAFLYPLRFVPAEKLPDMLTGLITAVCALSLLTGLLVMTGRFLESDDKQNRLPSNDAGKNDDSGAV